MWFSFTLDAIAPLDAIGCISIQISRKCLWERHISGPLAHIALKCTSYSGWNLLSEAGNVSIQRVLFAIFGLNTDIGFCRLQIIIGGRWPWPLHGHNWICSVETNLWILADCRIIKDKTWQKELDTLSSRQGLSHPFPSSLVLLLLGRIQDSVDCFNVNFVPWIRNKELHRILWSPAPNLLSHAFCFGGFTEHSTGTFKQIVAPRSLLSPFSLK